MPVPCPVGLVAQVALSLGEALVGRALSLRYSPDVLQLFSRCSFAVHQSYVYIVGHRNLTCHYHWIILKLLIRSLSRSGACVCDKA